MCRAEKLCCFNCLEWFDKGGAGSCEVCGDWNCPRCGSCLCSLSTREQKIAIAYMATYENLLREITEESYDFSRHERILERIGVERGHLTTRPEREK